MTDLQKLFKEKCNWFIEQTKEDYDDESNTAGAVFYNRSECKYYTETTAEDEAECSLITIGDDEIDDFAKEHDLIVWEDEEDDAIDMMTTGHNIETACDCKMTYENEGYIVDFNPEKTLHVVASGVCE